MDIKKYKPLRAAIKLGYDPETLVSFSLLKALYKQIKPEDYALSMQEAEDIEMQLLGHIQLWLIRTQSVFTGATHHIVKMPLAFLPLVINTKSMDKWEKHRVMMTYKEALEKAVYVAIEIVQLKQGTWISQ
jgi:hypothetical protein